MSNDAGIELFSKLTVGERTAASIAAKIRADGGRFCECERPAVVGIICMICRHENEHAIRTLDDDFESPLSDLRAARLERLRRATLAMGKQERKERRRKRRQLARAQMKRRNEKG